jgi:hypothetical protein
MGRQAVVAQTIVARQTGHTAAYKNCIHSSVVVQYDLGEDASLVARYLLP